MKFSKRMEPKGAAIVAAWLGAAALAFSAAAEGAPEWHYRVVAEYPHDGRAFTEGLAMLDGNLLESTGRYGESTLSVRDLAGQVLRTTTLDPSDFGEGATVVGRHIVQLTWKSGIGYVYDLELHRLDGFPLEHEGWGLTYDGETLIQSDGSATLHFLDSTGFGELRHIEVRDEGRPVTQLNELEWARGLLYANVWHDDRIAVIAPADGHVLAWIDLGELKRHFARPAGWNDEDDVLNGIAFDPARGHFFVTGKRWPKLFEIEILPSDRSASPSTRTR